MLQALRFRVRVSLEVFGVLSFGVWGVEVLGLYIGLGVSP